MYTRIVKYLRTIKAFIAFSSTEKSIFQSTSELDLPILLSKRRVAQDRTKRRLKQTLTPTIQTHQQEKGRQNGAHSTTETDSLEECKAFMAKTLEEKTKWILQAGLSYRCLSEGHRAKDCRQTIKCSICKDKHHNALLHKEKLKKPEGEESVDTKCTSLCGASEGGVSCCKLVLVDVVSKGDRKVFVESMRLLTIEATRP